MRPRARSQEDKQGIKGAIGGADGAGTGTLPMIRRAQRAPCGTRQASVVDKGRRSGYNAPH